MSTEATTPSKKPAGHAARESPSRPNGSSGKGKGKNNDNGDEDDEDDEFEGGEEVGGDEDEDDEDEEEGEEMDEDDEDMGSDDEYAEIDPRAIRTRRTRGKKVDYTSEEALKKAGLAKADLEKND